MTERYSGTVISGFGGFYQVRCSMEQVVECKPRGRLKKTHDKIYPGDEVEISLLEDGTGMIESIGPRRTALRRPNIVNFDRILIVLAWTLPDYDLLLLDRMLVLASQGGVQPLICFNKMDLMKPEDEPQFQAIRACYQQAGYQVLAVSAQQPESIAQLRKELGGGLSVLAGPSGVGKSSLINVLLGREQVETGEVSARLRRGKHTTRYATIMPLGQTEEEGFIADTPGFFILEFPDDFQPESLPLHYPEFSLYPGCRFDSCLHRREPDCMVKQAVEEQKIDRQRYERYLRLLEELQTREVKYR